MDDPILFNPDNRLLHASTGDFGMYGAQSDARFSVHEASDDAPIALADAPDAKTSTEISAISGPAAPLAFDVTRTVVAQPDTGSGALAQQAFLITPSLSDFAPVQHDALVQGAVPLETDGSPAEQGAGSVTTLADTTVTSAPVAEAAPIAEPLHIDSLSGGPLMGPAADLLDTLADGPALGGVTGLVDDVLAPVTTLVGDTLGSVTDLAGGVLTGTVGLVEDALAGLGGSDPQGGVDTLVNLVSVSDTFDLTPVVAPLIETIGDTGQGLVDALVGEDSLLGDHHDDGGLLGGHITPEHPLGL